MYGCISVFISVGVQEHVGSTNAGVRGSCELQGVLRTKSGSLQEQHMPTNLINDFSSRIEHHLYGISIFLPRTVV